MGRRRGGEGDDPVNDCKILADEVAALRTRLAVTTKRLAIEQRSNAHKAGQLVEAGREIRRVWKAFEAMADQYRAECLDPRPLLSGDRMARKPKTEANIARCRALAEPVAQPKGGK